MHCDNINCHQGHRATASLMLWNEKCRYQGDESMSGGGEDIKIHMLYLNKENFLKKKNSTTALEKFEKFL